MMESPLRFLMVADLPPDPDGGASGTQLRMIRWLRQLGHNVDAIWAADLPHYISHGNSHDIFEKPLGYRSAIRKKWMDGTFDVVCVNQPMGYLAARDHQRRARPGVFIRWSMGLECDLERAMREWLPRWGMRKRSRLKTVPGRAIDRLLYRQEALVARYADGHIIQCEQDREVLATEFGIPPERIANVQQAPLEQFQAISARPMSRDRLNRILTVGQFTPYKGLPHIAATVNQVLTMNPEARFTWAGFGADMRDAALNLLEPRVRDRCNVPGRLDDRDLIELFDTHGVFLFPSIKEGFGKAFLEAMARGLCVVATSVGGMRDVIVEGENGFLVTPGDVAGLVERIGRLWSDPELAHRVSESARITAARYTWERVAQETVRFCRTVLQLKAHSAPREFSAASVHHAR